MSLGLEIMIMVALLSYAVTGFAGIVVLVWYGKVFGPMFKLGIKYATKMMELLEKQMEEQEKELKRIK